MTFDQLISFYGSQAAAGRALGLAQPSIYAWKEDSIPFDRQCQIELLTGGKLKASREDDSRPLPARLAAQAAQ